MKRQRKFIHSKKPFLETTLISQLKLVGTFINGTKMSGKEMRREKKKKKKIEKISLKKGERIFFRSFQKLRVSLIGFVFEKNRKEFSTSHLYQHR